MPSKAYTTMRCTKYRNIDTMIQNVKEYTDFLVKHKISPNQYFFMRLIAEENWAPLTIYQEKNRKFLHSEIGELIDRGLVIPPKDPKETDVSYYSVSDKIRKELRLDSDPSPGYEFWDAYPPSTWINGQRVYLKQLDKEEFIEYYNNEVHGSLSRHRDIMRALQHGKNLDEVKSRIDRWLKGEVWKPLLEEADRISNTRKKDDGRL